MKDMEAGEEVTIDYQYQRIRCMCTTPLAVLLSRDLCAIRSSMRVWLQLGLLWMPFYTCMGAIRAVVDAIRV